MPHIVTPDGGDAGPMGVVEVFEPLTHGRKVGIGQSLVWMDPVQQCRLRMVRGDTTLVGAGDLVVEPGECPWRQRRPGSNVPYGARHGFD
jgi:hypothetical protein